MLQHKRAVDISAGPAQSRILMHRPKLSLSQILAPSASRTRAAWIRHVCSYWIFHVAPGALGPRPRPALHLGQMSLTLVGSCLVSCSVSEVGGKRVCRDRAPQPGGRFVPSVRAARSVIHVESGMKCWSGRLPFSLCPQAGSISLFPSGFVSWSLSEQV